MMPGFYVPTLGSHKDLFELQTPTETRDATGGIVQVWRTVRSFYGCLTPVGSREFWSARQVGASADYYLDCRQYEADITPKHRLKLGTRIFEINGITHDTNRMPKKTKMRVFEVYG